jgi:transcriptional regulator with XRE-family HTH domain
VSDGPLEALGFGAALGHLMQARGVSYRQLSRLTDLSGGYLNHLVHGNRPVPANEVIERIAAAFEIDPATFLDYRMRIVWDALSARPDLVDRLYNDLR